MAKLREYMIEEKTIYKVKAYSRREAAKQYRSGNGTWLDRHVVVVDPDTGEEWYV